MPQPSIRKTSGFAWLLVFFVAWAGVGSADNTFDHTNGDTGDDYLILPDRFDRPMVGTYVNGMGPLPFIIDTGASKSVIYRGLTAMIGLEALPNQSKRILTATGYKRVLVYPVTDFYVLGRTLKVEETVALPDIIGSDAKGLIGVDMLAGHTLFMDMANGTAKLAISPDSNSPRERLGDEWTMVQGRPVAYGSLALEVNIGGLDVPVIVDTGASDTVINSAGSEAVARSAEGIRRETIRASISGGQEMVFTALRVPEFNIGTYVNRDMRLVVSDVPVFALMGAREVPAIILGMDLLGQQPFAIDFKNWRLYLKTAEPTREPVQAR